MVQSHSPAPYLSSPYVIHPQSPFPIKPVLDLFLEIGRLHFPSITPGGSDFSKEWFSSMDDDKHQLEGWGTKAI